LSTGEVDGILEVPLSKVEELEKIPHVKLFLGPSCSIEVIEYNTTKPPLNDEKVRKALNYGIDREVIARVVYFGYAEPAYSVFCGRALETPNTLHLYKYDPDMARTLLTEAGWEDTDGDGIRDKDGEPLQFELWSLTEPQRRGIAVIAQSMWKDLGVNVTLQQFDRATLIDTVNAGEHDAVVFEHTWLTKSDMYNWWLNPEYMWYPQMSGFDTPELRELIDQTYKAATMEEVDETNDALVNYFYEHAPLCALVHPDNLMAFRDEIINIVPRSVSTSPTPYLYDVYRQDVYEANIEAAGE